MLTRKTKQYNNNDESVAVLEEVMINGFKQWLLIRGENVENPIMLFLHGGPGTAQIGFAPKFQRKLEKEFIVVNWDQRGAGISNSSNIEKEHLTIEEIFNDTIQVIEYLLRRLNKPKLFLVGHSWGTVLGTMAAKRIPQYLYAYIGIGQVANMQEGEKLSYQFTVNKAKELNNTKAFKELENLEFNPADFDYLNLQRKWLTKFGGSVVGVSNYSLIYSNMLFATEYTLKDWFTYIKVGRYCLETMWRELLEVNFMRNTMKLEVPVYMIAGKYDYQTPAPLAKQYFELLECPFKEFIWFDDSAHLPNFEEPEKFYQACLRIKEKFA